MKFARTQVHNPYDINNEALRWRENPVSALHLPISESKRFCPPQGTLLKGAGQIVTRSRQLKTPCSTMHHTNR